VGRRGQNLDAVPHKASQSALHLIEGSRCTAHFAGSLLRQDRGIDFGSQSLGGSGEECQELCCAPCRPGRKGEGPVAQERLPRRP
jgi:hypothetical protein